MMALTRGPLDAERVLPQAAGVASGIELGTQRGWLLASPLPAWSCQAQPPGLEAQDPFRQPSDQAAGSRVWAGKTGPWPRGGGWSHWASG